MLPDASLMCESVCWSVALVSTVRLDSVFVAASLWSPLNPEAVFPAESH